MLSIPAGWISSISPAREGSTFERVKLSCRQANVRLGWKADVARWEGMPPAERTPDRRYVVVIGTRGARLWRAANPALPEEERRALVQQLMDARRAVRDGRGDPGALVEARSRVDAAKRALGERGPVWWKDGAPDLNRMLIKNTPYWEWWVAKNRDHGAS